MVDYIIQANLLAEDNFKSSTICKILSKSITEQSHENGIIRRRSGKKANIWKQSLHFVCLLGQKTFTDAVEVKKSLSIPFTTSYRFGKQKLKYRACQI